MIGAEAVSGEVPSLVLYTAIGALFGALSYVARTAYAAMRDDRDALRRERDELRDDILVGLTGIMARMNEVARERDQMVRDLDAAVDRVFKAVVALGKRVPRNPMDGGWK